MSHDPHEFLPGYDPQQVMHDGCAECEQRSQTGDHGIAYLDPERFTKAWHRAADWNTGVLWDVARAEMPMLRVLWAIQLQLEKRGIAIGDMPVIGERTHA